ncbi:type VI secretion system-associated protein TagO [Halocynthiibacter sp.]|uniref:type VI secretion system-associated protein TagO n=1 Tax=Halocynthiibacter sp. TaxID=1979210 RepID=UPI003C59CA51
MFKIRTLIGTFSLAAFSAALAPPLLAQEGAVTIDRELLTPCFEDNERLSRLECYDRVLARPEVTDVTPEPEPEPAPQIVPAIAFLTGLLTSPDVSENGVAMILRERDNGANLRVFDDEGEVDLRTLAGETVDPETYQDDTDLFLALQSLEGQGEDATLVVSCQKDITRFRIYWYEPFATRTTSVRFHYDDSVTENEGRELRQFHVRGDGYVTENARGLDSIRLTRAISAADITQVGIGDSSNLRSAFFNTAALDEMLPLLAHHCSWALSNSSE